MKIKDVISALERFAPLPLQEEYDNAGLQVGLTEAEVSGVLLCLDVTESIISEAEEKGCNLIVSHHPLLFSRIRQISDTTMVQRCVMTAIQKGITIASMHTNLDSAEGGVNYEIANVLGLENIQLINPHTVNGVEGGQGIIAEFAIPLKAEQLISRIKECFHAQCVMTNELLERPIKKVVICGGAGSFLLSTAVKMGADAFLTGEMHYHDYHGHEQELQICVFGHYESEQFTKDLLQRIINSNCPGVKTFIGQDTNPIFYH